MKFIQGMLMVLTFALVAPGAASKEKKTETFVVELADNHKVFVKHHPAKKGEETVVLLNGLIYDLDNWNEYFEEMKERGFGVLQLAYSTQPESLRQLDEGVSPYFSETRMTVQGPRQAGIEIQTLVDETMAVVDTLGLKKFHLLTLSYGSIPGSVLASQQKERVKNLILVAPAVKSAHRYNAYGASRHAHYSMLPDFYEYYYDVELYNTMYPMILSQGTPEGVSFLDFFHGVYQMARSTKWFDLKDMAGEELPATHLFLASREDPPLYRDQIKFWELMEENEGKKSLVLFEGAPHALTGVVPKKAADMTEKVIRGEIRKKETSVNVEKFLTGLTSDSKSDDCLQLLEGTSEKE